MRRYLLAAVAAAAIATPALARDGSPYVGIEGGAIFVEDADFDVDVDDGLNSFRFDDAFTIDFKTGYDVDAIAGYDFGFFRVEGELGYKRFRAKEVFASPTLADALDLDNGEDPEINEKARVISLMANGLADFGDENDVSGYIGAGIGRARVKVAGDSDSTFAWQLIAGLRKAVTPNVDVGIKYRYFRTGKVNFSDEFNDGVDFFGINTSGKLRSHSLLASLIFNFNSPPPPPVVVAPIAPPPAPPPATQTCFDGSVILATDVCPQPPVEVAPPPPEPAPERG